MNSLSTFVQSPLAPQVLVGVFCLLTIAVFWLRTGSIHSVLDRLWCLITGQVEVKDQDLKSLLQETRDIEKFRFIYRLKAERSQEIQKLVVWMKTHRISMVRLQTIRRWIDLGFSEVIKQPPRYYLHCCFVQAVFAALAVLPLAAFSLSGHAYLKMRVSNIWFKTDTVVVSALRNSWSFGSAECKSNRTALIQLTGFNSSETEEICNMLTGSRLKPLIQEDIELQAWLSMVGVLILFAFLFRKVIDAKAAKAARKLHKEIYSKEENHAQMAD